jgi:hypothetical protein
MSRGRALFLPRRSGLRHQRDHAVRCPAAFTGRAARQRAPPSRRR